MRFADHVWLWGTALSALVAVLLVLGGLAHHRALGRFGDLPLVSLLKTARTGPRRALAGVLLVTALALAFVAAAQPQYGRGTRIVPATNLDVVLVLDFSKSMYARDISPSRIDRAKAEMGALVKKLAPARFGAVAFAGSTMTFPLTSDGAAVAQFFRGLEPNDMPVGGTAIGRALETADQLLARDPQSQKHERVIVLVTDGEDLEGDPVQVAERIADSGTKIHVVQIGGRAPEPIPDVDENGAVRGMRKNDEGQLLMTSLSADGEAQLAQIATKSSGTVVRSEKGETGIDTITRELRRVMTEELSERVETTYADVYAYPLALAVLLLVIEAFVGTSPKRTISREAPLEQKRRRSRRRGAGVDAKPSSALLVLLLPLLGGCTEIEAALDRVLVHHSPVVDDAIAALEQKQTDRASELLRGYLETGACEHGVIGTPDRVRKYPDATFDLGLTLFSLGEAFGQKFGADAAPDAAKAQDPGEAQKAAQRKEHVECALRLLLPLASSETAAPELRARAHFLSGNLEFLRGDYEAAVKAYDAALALAPARPKPAEPSSPEAADAPGALGRDIAHNRAIALRRIEEQEKKDEEKKRDRQSQDQEKDPQKQDQKDEEKDQDQKPEDQKDQDPKSGDQEQKDEQKPDASDDQEQKDDQQGSGQEPRAQNDAGDQKDGGGDEPSAPAAEGPSASQDDRLLDDLERAPTFQQQDAEKSAARRGRRRAVMEDK